MATPREDALELIERSITHDEIASAPWSQELEDALLGIGVDDYVTNGHITEFWGEREGQDWRVHLTAQDNGIDHDQVDAGLEYHTAEDFGCEDEVGEDIIEAV